MFEQQLFFNESICDELKFQQETCPEGWVDAGSVGCFLFQTDMVGVSWLQALEFCEEQVKYLDII